MRLPLRVFRYGALLVAIGGLVALFWAARGAGVPRLKISDVGATQNLAYVEIVGLVSQPVKYTPASQTLSFGVDDGSGSLTLVLPEKTYRYVSGLDGLRAGARVRAFGPTEIFNGELEIQPTEANAIAVLAPGSPATNVAAIQAIDLSAVGQTVTIAGEITNVNAFDQGTRLTVDDGTNAIVVLLWNTLLTYVPDSQKLIVGQAVRVTGRVDEYQGALEVVPQIGFDVIVQ